jgi:isoleucyl-tRNA synthetase
VVAKDLAEKQFDKKFKKVESEEGLKPFKQGDKIPYLIGESFLGKDLEEIKYHQLMPYVQPYHNPENAFRVIAGDFVTTEDGTGIVHTSPNFWSR